MVFFLIKPVKCGVAVLEKEYINEVCFVECKRVTCRNAKGF